MAAFTFGLFVGFVSTAVLGLTLFWLLVWREFPDDEADDFEASFI